VGRLFGTVVWMLRSPIRHSAPACATARQWT